MLKHESGSVKCVTQDWIEMKFYHIKIKVRGKINFQNM